MNESEVHTSKNANTLQDQYRATRALTEEICEPLQAEDFVVQPSDEVSPPKWHLAHTTWFFETFLLAKYVEDYRLFDKDYPYLFNSYYEHEGERWQRQHRGLLTRPWVKEIMAYRNYVDEHMLQFFENIKLNEEQQRICWIGIYHEQQHQELLVYDIKYIFGINPLFPVYRNPTSELTHSTQISDPDWLRVEEGLYTIGIEGNAFHFDNEEGKHKYFLHAFALQDRLVTCGEYLEFIESGGYQDFRHWLMEGFEWVKSEAIHAPMYWLKKKGKWMNYTLAGLQPIHLDLPVAHLSFYEADAFARWKGHRLPTEFEWEIACLQYAANIPQEANLLDKRNYCPVIKQAGNHQFYGDLWEWTQSAYLPYPYYKRVDGALGEYNGKFMINQMVLRGGSFATLPQHIRATYRNFFHPEMRWQLSGIRLAKHI